MIGEVGFEGEPLRHANRPRSGSAYVLRASESPALRGRESERRDVADPPGRGHGKAVRPSRRSNPSRIPGGVVHVREHAMPSWFTPSGVRAKLKMLEAKGLPDFGGWRFITLSCDQKYFGDCPLTAFLAGREHMRRFLDKCRESGLWADGAKWCWKLEFQRNGWPHWHLLVDRKRKFSYAQMRQIDEFWGLGRTNCRRVAKSQKFGYLFKYVFKGVYQEDGDGSLSVPGWFLDYFEDGDAGEKPKSFSRVRFWQTCKGFYSGPPVPVVDAEPQSCIVPRPVRRVVEDRNASYVVVARDSGGNYCKSFLVRMGVDRREVVRRHLWDVDNGAAVVLGVSSFVMAPDTLNRILTESDRWKLTEAQRHNRLTLARARQIREERRALLTF